MKHNKPIFFNGLALRLCVGLIPAIGGSVGWAQLRANLESPSPDAFVESGIGLIRGWACEAERIEISINNGAFQLSAPYGSRRSDTAAVCGHPNTGFGLTFPWYALGDGVHNLKAFADDVLFADVNFTVVTLGVEDFLTGLRGEYLLPDFPPDTGRSARVRWSQPHQNFVFAQAMTIPTAPPVPPHIPQAFLESPEQGSFESGIGLIRGWACEAERIEISINNGAFQLSAPYGSRRSDTAAVCGHPNTGFGLTFPWYALGDGVHNLKAFADDVLFAEVNFAVTTLGEREFLGGLRRTRALADFPSAGQTTEVRWSEPHQNFIVAQSTAAEPKVGILSAIGDRASRFAGLLAGPQARDDVIGMRATRSLNGEATQVTGFTWTDPKNGAAADLELTDDGLPAVYHDDATGIEARLSNINLAGNTVEVSFSRAGQAVAPPVTVSVNGGFLGALQAFANQFREAAQGVESASSGWTRDAAADWGVAPAASALPRRFSQDGLFVNTVWIGGVATGETLCAVQRAAEATGLGLLGQISARVACRSPTIESFLSLANRLSAQTLSAQVDAPFDFSRIDPGLQSACRFVEDVADAPCEPTDSNVACLRPAAAELNQSVFEEAGPPIPPLEAVEPEAYALTLNTRGTGSGAVTGEGQYEAGVVVVLTATPNPGSLFEGWTPPPCAPSFLMPDRDLTCTAAFSFAQ